ncbi:type I protein arginine methyltransferase [Malassezia psittaci]|uniref:type I protein arginine methyltransferase n=1 Tax=Malassezia psittaci TaxID=1821823 RepID=A0AAF0JF09_9BASI|nr:type I protein arginine methyltransferase [Malassezia psittaci]
MEYRVEEEADACPAGAQFVANDAENEGEDDFEGWVENEQPTRALFVDDTTLYPSPEAAVEETKAQGCDLRALVSKWKLDSFQVIRFINHVRRAKLKPADVSEMTGQEDFFNDDQELKPVPGFEEDGLLQLDFDQDESDSESDKANLAEELTLLRQAYQELRMQYAERVGVSSEDAQTQNVSMASTGEDSHYFGSYAGHDIHQTMIADSVRTLSYAQFILSSDNAHLLRGKTVMDVGCGSGILSLFCARAGAKQVIAIDASDVALRAEANVMQNGFSDVIRVYRGKIEELDTQLQAYVGQVDFLVSEWMGYFLLYESMLPSVLYARDRYLRKEGILAPSHCRMLLAAATDHGDGVLNERFRFWDNVYGFAMPSMTKGLTEEAATEEVEQAAIVSDVVSICELPLETLAAKQPEFVSPFELKCTETCPVFGLVAWFDTWFMPSCRVPTDHLPACRTDPIQASEVNGLQLNGNQVCEQQPTGKGQVVSFTTSPFGKQTHWKQTAFLFKTPIDAHAGMLIKGEIHVHASQDNQRELDVEIHYETDDQSETSEKRVKSRLVQLFSVR